MNINEQPISNVQWVEVEKLQANDYNPNVVFTDEMKLLKYSIQKSGWIQPILVTQDYVIIDGFHRATLAKQDKEITVDGKVPCVVMELSEPERMLLTIRINRAKGSHIAVKMSDIIHKLVNDYCMSIEAVGHGIGARKDEGLTLTRRINAAAVTELLIVLIKKFHVLLPVHLPRHVLAIVLHVPPAHVNLTVTSGAYADAILHNVFGRVVFLMVVVRAVGRAADGAGLCIRVGQLALLDGLLHKAVTFHALLRRPVIIIPHFSPPFSDTALIVRIVSVMY